MRVEEVVTREGRGGLNSLLLMSQQSLYDPPLTPTITNTRHPPPHTLTDARRARMLPIVRPVAHTSKTRLIFLQLQVSTQQLVHISKALYEPRDGPTDRPATQSRQACNSHAQH